MNETLRLYYDAMFQHGIPIPEFDPCESVDWKIAICDDLWRKHALR